MVERDRGNERATSTGGAGGGQSQPTTPGGKGYQQATQMKEQIQQTAADLKDQVAEQATGKVEEQKEAASGGLNTIAQAFRQTGDQLREQEQDGIAQYVDRAAEQIDHFGGYLERRDLRGMARDAEQFARRDPALFLGGAFTLGLFAARFLKSSGSGNGGSASGQATGRSDDTPLALPAPSAARRSAAPSASGSDTGRASTPFGLTADGEAIVGGPPASSDVIVGGPPHEPGKEPRR